MIQGTGMPVFPGVAIGSGVVYEKSQRKQAVSTGDPVQEQARFDDACRMAKAHYCRRWARNSRSPASARFLRSSGAAA